MLNPKKAYAYIKENIFLTECSNYNSVKARKNSRTKERGRSVFNKNNIPCAKGVAFTNPYKAYHFVKLYGFPVVVKPNYGGFSRGSFFPINNLKELWISLFLVKLFWPKTIIEEYIEGKNYRIVVAKGRVIAVTRRYAAFVRGDGKSTIKALINEENRIREQMKIIPIIKYIRPDNTMIGHLKKNQWNLRSIPKKGELVKLNRKITLSTGGVIENLAQNNIPKKNVALFKKVLESFESNLLGIDVILGKGIEFDYDKQKCVFLEVNSRPYLKMHKYPRYGNPVDIDALMEST
jgi:D-alanine-D-alanine ligase-like ATP-grasp enzyme